MSEWTIKKALEWTEGYLADKGDENPRLSAQWLLSEACGRRVALMTPRRGAKMDLIRLANKHAVEEVERATSREERQSRLLEALGLSLIHI